MKILLFSPSFYPNIGGLENISLMLARGLQAQQHEIRVIAFTELAENLEMAESFTIIRSPGPIELLRNVRWADIFLQNGLSLKGLWPLLIYRKKWVVIHQFTYFNIDGSIDRLEQIKRLASRAANNISCSHYVNNTLPKPGTVIYNCYDDQIFKISDTIEKRKELLFVGRLVSDKGCDTLLKALYILKTTENIAARLTIIGKGPEKDPLMELAKDYGLRDEVSFLGPLQGQELAEEMNQHQIIVIPSKWKEPFGIVALEGMACGCLPIVSRHGGLVEATGGLGLSFENGDADSLAQKLKEALKNLSALLPDVEKIQDHLSAFAQDTIVKKYSNFLKNIG